MGNKNSIRSSAATNKYCQAISLLTRKKSVTSSHLRFGDLPIFALPGDHPDFVACRIAFVRRRGRRLKGLRRAVRSS